VLIASENILKNYSAWSVVSVVRSSLRGSCQHLRIHTWLTLSVQPGFPGLLSFLPSLLARLRPNDSPRRSESSSQIVPNYNHRAFTMLMTGRLTVIKGYFESWFGTSGPRSRPLSVVLVFPTHINRPFVPHGAHSVNTYSSNTEYSFWNRVWLTVEASHQNENPIDTRKNKPTKTNYTRSPTTLLLVSALHHPYWG
jgi:hypothetical protein